MSLRRALLALATAAACAAGSACAAGPAPVLSALGAQTALPRGPAWASLPGTAVELSVGRDGAVFALDPKGNVWLRRADKSGSRWTVLPGEFLHVAALSVDVAWGLARDGGLHRFNGSWWEATGARARDVAVGTGGTVYVLDAEGQLQRFDPARGLIAMTNAPHRLARVAVGTQDLPWALDETGKVLRLQDGAWQALPGSAASLAVRDDVAFIVKPDGAVERWSGTEQRWEPIGIRARAVAVGVAGVPWIATAQGRIVVGDASAIDGRAPAAVATSRHIDWQRVRGEARVLAIAANGIAVALDREGNVWQLRGKGTWMRLPGKLRRVAIQPDGVPWGVDADGNVMRYQGSWWRPLPGRARDVSAGSSGAVWIVREDGVLCSWNAQTGQWTALESANAPQVFRFAVDAAGRPWVIDNAQSVWRNDISGWSEVPGVRARDIAIGPQGTVFVAGSDEHPYRYDPDAGRWEQLNGNASVIAAGPRDLPWIADQQGTIFAAALFEQEREALAQTGDTSVSVVPAPPANTGPLPTSREPLGLADFTRIPGAVERDLAIGNDGSVFAIGVDGALAQWSNAQNRFNAFPGQFARIAVAPDGKPWGVTGTGEVFRHNGVDWRPVYNALALDIAINAAGTVMIAGQDQFLYTYNFATDQFDRVLPASDGDPIPSGVRLAVNPRGKPWTIGADGRVRRCDRGPCEILPQGARDLDIGPEGSIFIVDPGFQLRRFNTATEEWDRIGIDATQAAVGPGGRPWIANGRSEVWESAFFRRDESGDVRTAVSTSGNTTTSSTPVFTFLLNMPFNAVPLPTRFVANPAPMARLAAGLPSRITVVDSGFGFWTYDSTRKILVPDRSFTGLPWSPATNNTIRTLAIASDGTYWISNNPSGAPTVQNTGIWRLQFGKWVRVTGLTDCAPTAGCTTPTPASIAIAADGTVYATSQAGSIYRYDSAAQRFVRVPIVPPGRTPVFHVAVDPSGKLWATTAAGSNVAPTVWEYTGNGWTSRFSSAQSLVGCVGPFYDAPCVSIGPNGMVYQTYVDPAAPGFLGLRRWNPQSLQWDRVSTAPTAGTFVVGSDNRPWIWDGEANLYVAR